MFPFGALLLLISLFGDKPVKYNHTEIGPVGLQVRIVSGILGIFFTALVLSTVWQNINISNSNPELQATNFALQTQIAQGQNQAPPTISHEQPNSTAESVTTIIAVTPNVTAISNQVTLPNTSQDAALLFGGDSSEWEKLSWNGWKFSPSAPTVIRWPTGWRADYTDINSQIYSCGDIYAPGVYGPAETQVAVATLWYVPNERTCPASSLWGQNKTTSSDITVSTSTCQTITGQLPDSPQDIRARFNIPSDKSIRVFYELCQEAPNGFIVDESPSVFTLQVPEGGCIDSYSGATFSEATSPENIGGGRRAYSGAVTTTSLTYRIAGCELKP
jgi:hypothetical protein